MAFRELFFFVCVHVWLDVSDLSLFEFMGDGVYDWVT